MNDSRARVALPRLVLSTGDRLLESIALDRPTLTIGRRADNDIALDHLTVSADHALVVAGPEGVRIRDLRSRNGTLVNGLRIDEHVMEHGDLVEVGIFRMRYVDESAMPGAAPLEEAPVAPAAGPPGAQRAPAGATETPLTAAHAVLECLDGSDPRRLIPVDQPIVALHVGEVVAVVSRRRQGHFVTHLEGGAFPRLNGIPIGLESQPLRDGDLIDLAGEIFRFRDPPPGREPAAGPD